jgi:hypothetical protein
MSAEYSPAVNWEKTLLTKHARAPKTFQNAYPEATFQTIHPNNYLDEFLNTPGL